MVVSDLQSFRVTGRIRFGLSEGRTPGPSPDSRTSTSSLPPSPNPVSDVGSRLVTDGAPSVSSTRDSILRRSGPGTSRPTVYLWVPSGEVGVGDSSGLPGPRDDVSP